MTASYTWIALEVAAAGPHDDECEVAARERPWKSCRCQARRTDRSRKLPEQPVQWPWLHGRSS